MRQLIFLLFAFVAATRFKWPAWKVGLMAAGFLVVDLAFWGANLVKIPHGGWFPLVVAGAIGLLWPRTVPWAAGGLTALLVAMFPANVYAALEGLTLAGARATCRRRDPGKPAPGGRDVVSVEARLAPSTSGVPPRLDAVVLRLLRPHPGDRFASAADANRALFENFLARSKETQSVDLEQPNAWIVSTASAPSGNGPPGPSWTLDAVCRNCSTRNRRMGRSADSSR